jgi:tripartite-type tricarboxylate transporter receptor subunit TctC
MTMARISRSASVLAVAFAALAVASIGDHGMAQTADPDIAGYPNRPVRIIVPFLAGGSTDTLGRLAAHMLSEHFGVQFAVENIAGAGGTIGATQVARAQPDGYMLLVGTPGSITINPHLQADLPYDPLRDFRPVAILGDTAGVVIVRKDSPVTSLAQLIAMAKEKPGALTFGSAGIGSFTHLGGELFEHAYGVKLTHVPYRGSSAATVDFLAGRLDVIFGSVQGYLGMGDQVKALGLAAAERSKLAPDIPTVDELGLPGYRSSSWTGLFAPAATPPAVIDKLNTAIITALGTPDMIKRYADLGVDPATKTPEQFAKFLAAEFAEMGTVLHAAGLTPH